MKKIKIALALVCTASLSACFGSGEVRPTKTVYKVVVPEEAYFTCDKVVLPDPETLDDAKIAKLINDLVKANKTCSNNMNAIKQYLRAAEQVLEERKD